MYLQVARHLENMIGKGNLKPGDNIGTAKDLVERYNVSRVTVMKAIKSLAEKGMLVSRQGKGTFVSLTGESNGISGDSIAGGDDRPPLEDHVNRNLQVDDTRPLLDLGDIPAKYAIQFPILLPFLIPFPEDYSIGTHAPKGSIMICFSNSASSTNLSGGFSSGVPAKISHYASLVKMYYLEEKNIKLPPDDHYLNIIFDKLLEVLNLIIASYTMYSRDIKVFRVTRADLEVSCIYKVLQAGDWKTVSSDMFLISKNIPYNKMELPGEACEQIENYLNALQNNTNPFLFSREILLYASRYFERRHYIEAVIFAQIGVESFIKNVFILLMKGEGKHVDTSKPINLFSIMFEGLKPYFGLNISEDSSTDAFTEWYKYTYELLQDTVRTGYPPNIIEADTAIVKAHKIITFIKSLIETKKDEFPELYRLVNC